MKKIILLFSALLMLLALSACGFGGNAGGNITTEPSQSQSQAAPDFTVYDKNGNAVKLSDMKGKPVVLNFWASWCGPCKREMPEFDKTASEFEGRVEFMMVNLTDGITETEDEALGFVASEGYTFPVYLDKDSDAARKYGISSIPTTYFIDAEGNIIANAVGMIDGSTLKQGISMIYTEINDK